MQELIIDFNRLCKGLQGTTKSVGVIIRVGSPRYKSRWIGLMAA